MCVSLHLLALMFLQVFVVLAVSAEQLVPPGERGGVVPHKVHVVEVMEISASVKWNEVEGVQRDVIPAT